MARRSRASRRVASAGAVLQLRAVHLGEIEYTDRVFGALLGGLAQLGLADDTIVVVTSDHGDPFGEHGRVGHGESLHNRILHVPLAFRWPGVVTPGSTQRLVGLVDVMPTALDLVGLPVPEDVDGRSLAPALQGRAPAPQREIVSELRHARGECKRLELPWNRELGRYAVQTGRFKCISSTTPRSEALARYLAAPAPEDAPRPPSIRDDTARQLEALGYLE